MSIAFVDGDTDVLVEKQDNGFLVHIGGDEPEEFPGSEDAKELFEQFTPLVADREVPEVDDEAMGFSEPAQLTVTCDSEHKIEVGSNSFGGRNRYIRYNNQGFLGGAQIFMTLEAPQARLMERRLLSAELGDVMRVEVHFGDESERIIQQNRGDRAAVWAKEDDPDHRAPEYESLMRKLFSLRASAYVAEPEGEEVMRAVVSGEDGELGTIVMRKADATPAEYYVQGEFGWVKVNVSSGRGLETDLERAFSDEEETEDSDEAAMTPAPAPMHPAPSMEAAPTAPMQGAPVLPPGHP